MDLLAYGANIGSPEFAEGQALLPGVGVGGGEWEWEEFGEEAQTRHCRVGGGCDELKYLGSKRSKVS